MATDDGKSEFAEEEEDKHGDEHMAESPELSDEGWPERPADFVAFGPKMNRAEMPEDIGDIVEECRRKAAGISQNLGDDERHALEFILNTIEENFGYETQEPWKTYAARLTTDVLDEYAAGKRELAADNLFDLRQEMEENLQ
ncbi:MAG: hypothetical protein ACM3NH_04380 [Candidatus Saccharibacteria bacterium]